MADTISATENVNVLKKRKSANDDDDEESVFKNEDVKKAKLEPKGKGTKKHPPGSEEERYKETSYYIEDNLRKVVPYYFGKQVFF